MSHPGAFAQQRCGGVGSTCFFELVTANCEIQFSRLKDLTTHDMRVIEEMASTVSGDVSVAERACAVRCVLGHLKQEELEFIIENIDAYQCDHQVLRSDLFPRGLQCSPCRDLSYCFFIFVSYIQTTGICGRETAPL